MLRAAVCAAYAVRVTTLAACFLMNGQFLKWLFGSRSLFFEAYTEQERLREWDDSFETSHHRMSACAGDADFKEIVSTILMNPKNTESVMSARMRYDLLCRGYPTHSLPPKFVRTTERSLNLFTSGVFV